MIKRVLSVLNEPATAEVDRRRLTITFLIFALVISLVSSPLVLATPVQNQFIVFLGVLLVSLFLAYRNILWLGRVLVPIAAFLFVTLLLFGGGIHDDALGGYYLLLVVAALLLGRTALIGFGILNTLAIIAIGLAETSGVITTRFGPLTQRETIVTSAVFMAGTTLALYFMVVRLNQAARIAHESALAQAAANLQLRELQDELERRVAERTSELDFANQQLQMQMERVNSLQSSLQEQAVRDPLTGLLNRRHLDDMLPIEIARAKRSGIPITILMMDLDHFKDVNDSFGHQIGDRVLQSVAEVLKGGIRAGDVAMRYGGEEFVLLLPGMRNGDAKMRAEKLRALIEAHEIHEEGHDIRLTISIGASIYPPDGETVDQLISAADRALYRAKQNGRNRVEMSQE